MNRWVFFFIFIFIAEFYTWQAVRTSFENKWVSRIYLLVSVLVIIFLVMSVLSFNQRAGLNRFSMFVISIFSAGLCSKNADRILYAGRRCIQTVWRNFQIF